MVERNKNLSFRKAQRTYPESIENEASDTELLAALR